MVSAPFALGANKRSAFPGFPQLNLYAEKSPTSPDKPFALVGRPGLENYATVGDGPIRALHRKSGLFDDGAIILSDETVYKLSTSSAVTAFTGSIPGRERVSIASGRDADQNDVVRIANDLRLYKVTGTTTTAEDFPAVGESDGATSIAYIRGFWIAIKTDTQQAYYLVPGDTDWTALSFASAEYQPDKLIAVMILGDQIWFLGAATTEVWALTGQASPAIQPYGGLNFDIGCRARDSAVVVGSSLIWVGNDCSVYLSNGGVPKPISDNGLAEQIRRTNPLYLRAWGYVLDQHVYYLLTLEDETWIYDGSTGFWNPANSKGYNYFRAHIGSDVSGLALAADALPNNPQIWRVNPDALTDADDEIERLATAFLEWKGPRTRCANVSLLCELGNTGQGEAPQIGMRWSDDGGKTFSDWLFRSIGRVGEYSARPVWNRLGDIRPPGRVFQFKSTDPAVVRLSDCRVNEDVR
jgi:hypothetical protein